MPRLLQASADRIADHFINYLFEEFHGARHVRRVASWVGLIVMGIAKVVAGNWKVSPKRQLRFSHMGTSFKAKYNHKAGPRGGIEIVELLPGRGSPEGRILTTITSLDEAEDFYNRAAEIFRKFASSSRDTAQSRLAT